MEFGADAQTLPSASFLRPRAAVMQANVYVKITNTVRENIRETNDYLPVKA